MHNIRSIWNKFIVFECKIYNEPCAPKHLFFSRILLHSTQHYKVLYYFSLFKEVYVLWIKDALEWHFNLYFISWLKCLIKTYSGLAKVILEVKHFSETFSAWYMCKSRKSVRFTAGGGGGGGISPPPPLPPLDRSIRRKNFFFRWQQHVIGDFEKIVL